MNLRVKKPKSFDPKEQHLIEFNFTLIQKEFTSNHNNKKYKIYEVDEIPNNIKLPYKLHTIQSLSPDCNTNENEILINPLVVREYISKGDILYCIKSQPDNFYMQYCKHISEIYTISLENKDPLNFIFIPFTLYQILVLDKDIEKNQVKPYNTNRGNLRDVKQRWDYENQCQFCGFIFLESHSANFRKSCCCEGLFTKRELPPVLRNYCKAEDNKYFNDFSYIYNNLLAFGRLGVDKKFDSRYTPTQGGSVCLQGRTFLTDRRSADRQALVFFFNGVKYSENDRIFQDLQHVLSTGEGNADLDHHVHTLNSIREEQFYVNQIASQYTQIYECMSMYEHTELMLRLPKTPVCLYDISSYRLKDNVNPAYHIMLKFQNQSHTIPTTSPLYETVAYPFLFPWGEMGYCKNNTHLLTNGKCISRNRYVTAQVFMPEPDMYYISPKTGRTIPCNRFNIWTKLSQYYMVDQLSRFIDGHVDHQEKLQKSHFSRKINIDSDSDESDDGDEEEGNTDGKKILGECITGSLRHLRKLSLCGMHIVANLGTKNTSLILNFHL
jgi:hypothetical protein